MAEIKRPLKVFLCHASQDKPVVRELSRRLASEGWIDPWVDEKKLLPGHDWRTKIEEAVETSDIVIICLSTNSVSKEGFVQKELRYAREIAFEKPDETIFLIPMRLEDCTVPRGLRFYQWGDYFGEEKEDEYYALLESLKLRYEQKLKFEAEEHARREIVEKERITFAEKVHKEAEERARLEAEERVQKERAERELKAAEKRAQEKATREQARKDAEEKARLGAREEVRQQTVKELEERETGYVRPASKQVYGRVFREGLTRLKTGFTSKYSAKITFRILLFAVIIMATMIWSEYAPIIMVYSVLIFIAYFALEGAIFRS